PGTQFSHFQFWRQDSGDTHADRLALYPAAGLLCASQQLVSKCTICASQSSAGLFHFGFFSLQSDFRPRSCLTRAFRCRVDKSVWTFFAKIAIRNKGTWMS